MSPDFAGPTQEAAGSLGGAARDVQLQILGPVGFRAGGIEVTLPAGKPRAILALLGVRGGGPLRPTELVTSLWGEEAPESAVKTLQVHVSTLRKRLRPFGVDVRHGPAGYSIDLEPRMIDVVRFERLAAEGAAALAGGRVPAASQLLRRALASWSGEPLSNVLEAPFAAREADRLNQQRIAVFQTTIDADLELGLGSTLVSELTEATQAHPFNEHLCAQLMTALYRSGQPADALAALQRLRTCLVEELGIDAGPALGDLEMRILNHDVRLVAAPRRPASPSKLPAELSTFVGRRSEVAAVKEALQQSRLVTLTGAGGSGKTRLARRAATDEASRYVDGASMVELAALADPQLVAASVASSLGIRDDPERPIMETISEALAERSMLILLDNCEHVIDAAAQLAEALLTSCPQLSILATSREPLSLPGERVLRVPPLGLAPLNPTSPEEIAGSDSVRLFVDRTSLHTPGFAATGRTGPLIAEICRRLDGMPLAIELAAAQLRTFTVDELASLLDERFRLLSGGPRRALARHQTLRALIDWSYDLLTGDQQLLLDTLSVFAGGFTLDAAQSVCSWSPGVEVRGVLSALVDKSLVESDRSRQAGRFRLMETIREYAAERLFHRGSDLLTSTRAAHAAYYLSIAEDGCRVLVSGGDEVGWLERLDLEHDNLRAASTNLLVADEGMDGALRLATALRPFWDIRGHVREGSETMSMLLAQASSRRAGASWALALTAATDLYQTSGQRQRCDECAVEAVASARLLGDPALEAETQLLAARALIRKGDVDEALEVLERQRPAVEVSGDSNLRFMHGEWTVIALFHAARRDDAIAIACELVASARQGRRHRYLAVWLANLAYLSIEDGDLEGVVELLTEAEAHAARLGFRSQLGYISANLGLAAIQSGNPVKARIHFEQARAYGHEVADLLLVAYGSLGLALCATAEGRHMEAARQHGAADAALADAGLLDPTDHKSNEIDPVEARLRQADQDRLRDILGSDAFSVAHREGATVRFSEPASPTVGGGAAAPGEQHGE